MTIRNLNEIVADYMIKNFHESLHIIKKETGMSNTCDLTIASYDFLVRRQEKTTIIEFKSTGDIISLSILDYTTIEIL